ncbi:hypothetical protein QO189_12605 [Psychrobacter sp. Arc29]|uniref:hypothetical protein n=1 Tax=Psychrobacter sp. Arc29 TaxID=3046690 RepID=UPI00352CD4F5
MINLTRLIRLFQCGKKQNDPVFSADSIMKNDERPSNKVTSVELLQTMQWSKLCWNESWEEVIKLDSLLPKVGQTYPIKLDENEDYAEEGHAYLLWLPPHSELNGWWDKRPSEILKSYVLEGTLSNAVSNYEKREYFFDFQVISRKRLVDYFASIHDIQNVYVPYIIKYKGNLASAWENAQDLSKFKVGNYLYLHGVKSESSLEAIFSFKEDRFCLHYSAILHHPADYETVVTRYYLDSQEQKLFSKLIEKANEITDNSIDSLEDSEVHGAEYW